MQLAAVVFIDAGIGLAFAFAPRCCIYGYLPHARLNHLQKHNAVCCLHEWGKRHYLKYNKLLASLLLM